MNGRLAARRVRAHAHRLLKRAGYTVVPTALPGNLTNPLPIELAAQRVVQNTVLRNRRVNCVLDVGAHAGSYAGQLRQAGYKGEIVSFEPVERSFRELSALAEKDPRWRAHRLALGSTPGEGRLHVTREPNFSTFLQPNRFSLAWYAGSVVEHDEVVEVQRLDAIFDEVTAHIPQPRALLKTDTQGFDLEVIKGARGCLDRIVAMQVELSVRAIYEGAPGWVEVLSSLEELGFHPAHFSTANRDANFGVVEFDCILVPRAEP